MDFETAVKKYGENPTDETLRETASALRKDLQTPPWSGI